MSVKPILFNTDMVRAILDGRKTCTRRVVKPQQFAGILPNNNNAMPNEFLKKKSMMFKPYCDMTDDELIMTAYKEPYQLDDILYVRETWKKTPNGYYYFEGWQKNDIADITKWKPSIHMPKEAARIWLRVTDVRVERLQKITEDAIKNEGVILNPKECVGKFDYTSELYFLFQRLWNSTIKKSDLDRYGWDANPWVWVIKFERYQKPKEEN